MFCVDLSEVKNIQKRKNIKLNQSITEGPPEPKYGGELRKTRSEPFYNTWDIHAFPVCVCFVVVVYCCVVAV